MDAEPIHEWQGELARDLLDLAYDAVLAFRLPDEVIVSWNRGAEEMYGWSAEEAIGRTPQELLDSDFAMPRRDVMEALRRDRRWSGTIVQTRRDGRPVIVDARWALQPGGAGSARIVLEINRDVTERELAAERFRLVVESLRDYAIFMLDARGRVVRWNAGAEAITGWPESDVLGRPMPVRRSENDTGWLAREAVEQAERSGSWSREGWLVRKGGTPYWARLVVTPLRGPVGLTHGFAVVLQDDTARRELEASRENFVNFAAHEMRAPVTLLYGYLSMLDEGDLSVESFQSALPLILARTQELQLLIEQMIESSRLEQGRLELKMETVDLRPIVEELVDLTRRLAGSRHRVEAELPTEPVEVVADPGRTRSIIRNLLDNAVKYSPGGGEVLCRVTVDGEVARVTVTDSGIGIRDRDRSTIFSRYGRVRSPETRGIAGAGLGLYMSRELARLQNGELDVESAPGRGSTFTLTLPIAGRRDAPEPTFDNTTRPDS